MLWSSEGSLSINAISLGGLAFQLRTQPFRLQQKEKKNHVLIYIFSMAFTDRFSSYLLLLLLPGVIALTPVYSNIYEDLTSYTIPG